MDEFGQLKRFVGSSGCTKKQIVAGTYVNGNWKWATNTCSFEGESCPRLNLPSGAGYDLCKAYHAEDRLADTLLKYDQVSDGIVWVYGHYYACEPCASKLKLAGAKEIRVRESLENGQGEVYG